MKTQYEVDKWLDGIKMVGTGNSAGLFGGLVALYYFKDRPELLHVIKVATGQYLAGVVLFAISFVSFLAFLHLHPFSLKDATEGKATVYNVTPAFHAAIFLSLGALGLWFGATTYAAFILYNL